MIRTLSLLLLATALGAVDSPTVSVTGGQVRGATLEKGGAVFKGIPFAQPPVGPLRWRVPQPLGAWPGVRDATAFGPPCAQNRNGHILEGSKEDCLYLNVWTPEWPSKSRKPVMVWIHGGGNYGGTASTDNFDGESLARHGVVLVSMNYRLTVFGFFSHPELTKESPQHASGNYGLLDQIAALRWVHDNISRFGGDPGNVTIFGQSAGAVDVSVLLTSPLAKGLFQRAIAESGTASRTPDDLTLQMTALGPLMAVKSGPVSFSDAPDLAEAEQNGEARGASLDQLRRLSAEDLLKFAAEPRKSIGPGEGVTIDHYVFPKPPAEVFAAAKEQRVALLAGSNSRERTPRTTPEQVKAAMGAMYGPLAAKALALYGPPDSLYGSQETQWVVDTMYRCPVVSELSWHAAAGNVAYEYQFDRAAPGREELGAVHGAELPYVFGRLGSAYAAVDHEISNAIEEYWTNFAKTGNPNGTGMPQWPRFDPSARAYMEFTDQGPQAHEGLRRPYCDLFLENVKRLMAP